MNFGKLHIAGVLSITVLFTVFTLMHQFEWLIPPLPVAPVSQQATVPFPDLVEEYGGEDDIEHEFSEPFYFPKKSENKRIYMIAGDLFFPRISTPPPDTLV